MKVVECNLRDLSITEGNSQELVEWCLATIKDRVAGLEYDSPQRARAYILGLHDTYHSKMSALIPGRSWILEDGPGNRFLYWVEP